MSAVYPQEVSHMPRLSLPSGAHVIVGVFHEEGELSHSKQKRRQTRVRLSLLKEPVPADPKEKGQVTEEVTVRSVVHTNDSFNPYIGRYRAAISLLKTDIARQKLSKQDRGAIIKHIVPELFLTREERERNLYTKLHRKYGEKKPDIKVADAV